MSQSAVMEREIVRETDRRSPPTQTDAKVVAPRTQAPAAVVERVRNVGGRLMA